MKKGAGSSKGSAFERELCKRFSLWVSKGKRDDLYWRTAGSGARATTRGKRNLTTENSCGDMMCLSPEGKWLTDCFSFEFKRGYNTWNISEFLMCEENGLVKVWEKLNKEASTQDKIPILIFKQDRKDSFLFSFPSFFDKYKDIPILKGSSLIGEVWATKLYYIVPRLARIPRARKKAVEK